MSEQVHQRELGEALAAVLNEPAGAERYRRSQREARSGRAVSVDRPRPLEFDESGFPVRQGNPSFVARVARLLSSS
jgi:hypothetical protein